MLVSVFSSSPPASAVPLPRVVMLAPRAWPHRGGVETHLAMMTRELEGAGWLVQTLVPLARRPGGKLGLIWLWLWMLSQLPSLLQADVIHIHDVFLWFWPVWPVVKLVGWLRQVQAFGGREGRAGRPLKIITTFHGWEGTYPPTWWQRFNKWVAQRCSDATVAVGQYVTQFYPIQPAAVLYGGVEMPVQAPAHSPVVASSDFVYLGRLASDTGLPWLLAAVRDSGVKGEFWGDGPLRASCAAVGQVKGWVAQPLTALAQTNTHWVIASGYLTVLEALATGQRVLVIADNPLKQAYYREAPFAAELTIVTSPAEIAAALRQPAPSVAERSQLYKRAAAIRQKYTWAAVARQYLDLYAHTS